MQDQKPKDVKAQPRIFQLPPGIRSSETERAFSEQTLKKLLRKKKDEPRLTKAPNKLLASQTETRETRQVSVQQDVDMTELTNALAFGTRILEETAGGFLNPSVNSMSVFMKDKEEPPKRPDTDESR